MADGAGARTRTRGQAARAYRFFTEAGETDLEGFLAAIVRRGEAKVATDEPGYTLTAKGRKALEGAA